MESEDKLLFLLARQELAEEHQQSISRLIQENDIRWDVFYKIAKSHGVAPLVYTLIRRHPDLFSKIPRRLLDQFRLYVSAQILLESKKEQTITRAYDFFKSKSIEVMLIKGTVLNYLVYENPWYTVSNDIDIILKRKRQELKEDQITEITHYFHNTGVEFDFFEHHDVNMNGVLPVDFHQLWRDSVIVKFFDREFRVMCLEDLIISLCINSCRKRYFRLKSLCDIAETVRKNPDLNWSKLADRAHQYGCTNIVYAALYVTMRTVGSDLPLKAVDKLHINRMKAHFIRFCANILIDRIRLDSHMSPGRTAFGRKMDLSLILTYATYSPGQVRQKISQIQRTWLKKGANVAWN